MATLKRRSWTLPPSLRWVAADAPVFRGTHSDAAPDYGAANSR